MAKARQKKKRRSKRSKTGSARRSGGMMLGMRSGFKNVAHSVTGAADASKSSRLSTAVTIALIAVGAFVLYGRL